MRLTLAGRTLAWLVVWCVLQKLFSMGTWCSLRCPALSGKRMDMARLRGTCKLHLGAEASPPLAGLRRLCIWPDVWVRFLMASLDRSSFSFPILGHTWSTYLRELL